MTSRCCEVHQRGFGLPLEIQDHIRRIMMDEIREQQNENQWQMIDHLQAICKNFGLTNTNWRWVFSTGASFVFKDYFYKAARGATPTSDRIAIAEGRRRRRRERQMAGESAWNVASASTCAPRTGHAIPNINRSVKNVDEY